MRKGFGLGDRLFQLATIFLHFKQALNSFWVIPVGSGKGRFAQVSSFTPSAKYMQKVSWEVCAFDAFPLR